MAGQSIALNIIFMGTAELSCVSLAALLADARVRVTAVVTQPDKPKGRDLELQPSAVKVLALKSNLRAPGMSCFWPNCGP